MTEEELTVEDVGGLGRLIDERRVLRLTCEVLLRGEHPDEAWLYGTLARTTGEIEDVEREVLPAGEHRADFIASWNAKCRELAAETARYLPIIEALEDEHETFHQIWKTARDGAAPPIAQCRNPVCRAMTAARQPTTEASASAGEQS